MNKLIALLMISSLWVISCGKPHDPESIVSPDNSGGYRVVSRYATPGNSQDVIVKDNLAYMAQGEGGLLILSLANWSQPDVVSVTSQGVRGYSTRIVMKDSVVYLAAGTYGVTALNVTNPFEPLVTVSNLNVKPARNLHLLGDYMFVAVSELGVKICELSYPTQPDIRGGVNTSGYSYGVTTTSDSSRLVVANGEMGISVFDISNFEEGYGEYPLIGWRDTPGYAESVVLDETNNIAFMACGNSGLLVLNISDTANIMIVGSFYNSGYAKALIYKDQKIFLAARRGGLQIIDVADVTNPKLIGRINSEGALGLDVQKRGNWYDVYVADEVEGLIIVTSEIPVSK